MNKVMLIGNVGVEPDVRYYEADQAVVNLRFATNEKGYTLPNGTCVPDRTDWHNLVFYRRLAKVVERYVHKGDKLYVEGRLQYTTKVDKRGMERQVAEIIVDTMELLGSRTAPQNAPTPQQSEMKTASSSDKPVHETRQLDAASEDEILPF